MSGAFPRTPTRSPTRSADHFVLTLWTSDPGRARQADAAGVDRIGIDLERLGKAERQRGLGTWISPHREEDLDDLRATLSRSELFARVNPLNPATGGEVEGALSRGVSVVMLPMVSTADEAAEFARLVDGRATVVLLVETGEAIRNLGELVAVEGVDEIHIGINDLALSLGMRNRWMTMAGDLAVEAGAVVHAAGKRFGLGAVGRPGDRGLPVPVELVYAEYARTRATAALVSRSFFRPGLDGDLSASIAQLRRELAAWGDSSADELADAHAELARCAERADCF